MCDAEDAFEFLNSHGLELMLDRLSEFGSRAPWRS